MRLGKNLLRDRAPKEVRYYDGQKHMGRAMLGPKSASRRPSPYGVSALNRWMPTAAGLPQQWIWSGLQSLSIIRKKLPCPERGEHSDHARTTAGAVGHGPKGRPKQTYYACGWEVRPGEGESGRYTKWHSGLLAGSSTLLVCREDGINWAVLFNSDSEKGGKEFAGLIDPLLHQPANEIESLARARFVFQVLM